MNYLLRKTTEKDIPQIVKLNSLLSDHHHNIDKYWNAGIKTQKTFGEYVKNEIKKPNTMWLVVQFEDKIIGYFSGEINTTNPAISIPKIGHLSNGFILKEFRGNGISKKAIGKIITWFKKNNIKIAELTVSSKNIEGLRAWENFGFKEYMKKMKMKI